jgi:hypothetical protein
MPSVSSTHGWIPIAQARTELEAAGYLTEYTPGNAALYVRRTAISFPSRLYSKGGLVSPRSVQRLIKKIKS